MITDIINTEWLRRTDKMANEYEFGDIDITEFSNDQLQYLVYFNWGYSGVAIIKEAADAEAELERRGYPYNQELAEMLDEMTQDYL